MLSSARTRSSRYVLAQLKLSSPSSRSRAIIRSQCQCQQYSIRCFGNTSATHKARTQFEDDFHLARSLGTPKIIDPQKLQKWKKIAKTFRTPNWALPLSADQMFTPGYEHNALEEIHARSYDANVLVEIRDVRLPASTHHPSFTRLAKHRLHLIVYTHADLISPQTRDRVEDWTLASWPDSRPIFVDTREQRPSTDLQFDLVYDSLLQFLDSEGGTNTALTVGVPNTGKSSILMILIRLARQRGAIGKKLKATAAQPISKKKKKKKVKRQIITSKKGIGIQDKPGKTREVTEFLVRDKPRAFVLDVPGMTPPRFFFEERPEAWWGFGAANLLLPGPHISRDLDIQTGFCALVLHALNRDANFEYVHKLNGLEGPTDDIGAVLKATKRHLKKNTAEEDEFDPSDELSFKRCEVFLKLFQTGNFGSVILDDLRYLYQPFVFQDRHFAGHRNDNGTKSKRFVEEKFDGPFDDEESHDFEDYSVDEDDMDDDYWRKL